MSIEDYNKILKKHFNLNSLKKEQYDIINTIVNFQKDVMAIWLQDLVNQFVINYHI